VKLSGGHDYSEEKGREKGLRKKGEELIDKKRSREAISSEEFEKLILGVYGNRDV